METPFQLEIQGLEPSSHIRDLIASNIVKLEARYGRITSCRVVVQAPGAHHRMGEPYAVSIHLALPNGREVNVGRVSKGLDHRQADLVFAINDAFRRVVRQLRDHARKLRGETKQNHVAPEGKVASLDPGGNCGFLTTDDGREIYFHAHSVLGDRFRKLQAGDRVAFHEEVGEKGPQASTVRVLGALSPRR
jgi:cold shock CspA family protein